MVPVSYGPTKQVEPIEKDSLIGYTDKHGNDYVGVAPDFNKEPWFSELINKNGLENLCAEYPYQPLKVDKETAMLVPASNSFSNPIAKLTNCFHVIYHMRKDKLEEQNPLYSSLVDRPSIGLHGSNLTTNLVNNSAESKGVTPNWSSAYHHEIEIPQIHDVCVNNFIENEEDDNNKHAITNVDVNVTLDTTKVPKGWHPNDGNTINQQVQPFAVSNTQPNPYAYNPAYGMGGTYLPQYKTTTVDNTQYPFLSFGGDSSYDMFEDAMRRRAETEQANIEYAKRTNLYAKQTNPTLLDTSSTVDFSNPESVAKMQGMYANPYYNNMNNPNFMTQPQNQQYGMSNPYGGVVNPLYGQYNTNGYYGGGWWNNNGFDLGFMNFSPEEIRLGKGFSVKLTRGKKESQTISKKTPKLKKTNKIQVQLVKVVEVVKDGKIVQIPKDQYKEEEAIEEEELKGSTPDREQKAFKWYGEEYKKQVVQLAKDLADYDEARALCLVGSLDDANVTKYDFKYYYKACEEKLHWFRVQEQANPEKDYRVPFRYRKTPIPMKGIDGKLTFESYTIPMKRFVTLPTKESVPFYEFDRGREPNDDEWTAFYEQAEYIRDQEIQIQKAKAVEEYEKNNRETYVQPYYYTNSIEARLQELRNEERIRKNQYDVFRTAYGSSISDVQFDAWWYRGNYAAMPNRPRTEEEVVAQRKQWRHNMGMQHTQMLNTFQPLDHEKIKQQKTEKINQLVREFDRGTMEGCKDLKDFFDRLGYLGVRVCEENIARQRAADLSNSLTVNRYDYNQQLQQAANYNPFPNDPYYQNRPHYMDFVNSAEYADRKKEFFDYCSTSTGTIPLRPIYK